MQARANKSWIAVGLAALVTAGGTQAAGYPERTVTMIVPAAAGGTTDLAARMAAQALAPVMGQSVVVDNKAGGNGNVAAALVKRAEADGYTLLMANSSFAINPGVFRNLGFNPKEDHVIHPVSFFK